MITYKLAREIVTQTMLRLHHNINVINLDGTILASGDVSRIEHYHAATKKIIKTKKAVIIDESNMERYPNTKPGINLPIFFQDEIVCIIGITGDPKSLKEIAPLIQLTAEVIVNQALLESKFDWQRKMSMHIFNELVEGTEIKGILKERIQKLPFSLQPPFTVILIKSVHKSASHRTLTQYLEDFFHDQPILYGHDYDDLYYILTTHQVTTDVEKQMTSLYHYLKKHFDLQIGLGKTVEQLSELPLSNKTASISLQETTKDMPIVFFDQIEIKTLFDAENTMLFSNELLKPISPKLMQTLEVLFQQNLHLASTAEALQIHRHTLTYRLEKITMLTNLNPLSFHDAMKLQIALWFLKNKTA